MTDGTNVTVFFRDGQYRQYRSWMQSKEKDNNNLDIHLESTEEKTDIISDRDAKNLEKLSMCLYDIHSQSKKEGRKTTYDNPTLEEFMNDFALMLDNIRKKKNIKDYISYYMGVRFGLDVSVKYVE